jgi:cell shape-determining protein MreC
MSESSRSDIATFKIECNLPPEIIKAYFDGLAKVEVAKNSKSDKSSGFDWSSFLGALIPSLMPVFLKSSSSSPMIRKSVSIESNKKEKVSKELNNFLDDIIQDAAQYKKEEPAVTEEKEEKEEKKAEEKSSKTSEISVASVKSQFNGIEDIFRTLMPVFEEMTGSSLKQEEKKEKKEKKETKETKEEPKNFEPCYTE